MGEWSCNEPISVGSLCELVPSSAGATSSFIDPSQTPVDAFESGVRSMIRRSINRRINNRLMKAHGLVLGVQRRGVHRAGAEDPSWSTTALPPSWRVPPAHIRPTGNTRADSQGRFPISSIFTHLSQRCLWTEDAMRIAKLSIPSIERDLRAAVRRWVQ